MKIEGDVKISTAKEYTNKFIEGQTYTTRQNESCCEINQRVILDDLMLESCSTANRKVMIGILVGVVCIVIIAGVIAVVFLYKRSENKEVN